MLKLYHQLQVVALSEYKNIVTSTKIIGKRTVGSAKLRMFIKDSSFLDIWLSPQGRYSYHWEQRAQRGLIYRHDNAPDFPAIKTFPKHFHNGCESKVISSNLSDQPQIAIKQMLKFISQNLK